ncbi:unnamed protein product, partial [Ectocarpus sp. 8 AP-2014]
MNGLYNRGCATCQQPRQRHRTRWGINRHGCEDCRAKNIRGKINIGTPTQSSCLPTPVQHRRPVNAGANARPSEHSIPLHLPRDQQCSVRSDNNAAMPIAPCMHPRRFPQLWNSSNPELHAWKKTIVALKQHYYMMHAPSQPLRCPRLTHMLEQTSRCR